MGGGEERFERNGRGYLRGGIRRDSSASWWCRSTISVGDGRGGVGEGGGLCEMVDLKRSMEGDERRSTGDWRGEDESGKAVDDDRSDSDSGGEEEEMRGLWEVTRPRQPRLCWASCWRGTITTRETSEPSLPLCSSPSSDSMDHRRHSTPSSQSIDQLLSSLLSQC